MTEEYPIAITATMVSTQNDCVLATRKRREIRFRSSNTVLNTSNLSRFCSAFFRCFYFVIAYERNALTFNRMHAAVYSHVFCMPTSPVEYLLFTAAHILCTSSLSIDHEKKKNDWMLYWTPLLHVKHTIVTRRHAWNAKHWIRFTRNPIQLCKAFAILTYNSVALGGRVEIVRKGHFKAIWRIWSFCWIDISSQYGCCAKRAYMYI